MKKGGGKGRKKKTNNIGQNQRCFQQLSCFSSDKATAAYIYIKKNNYTLKVIKYFRSSHCRFPWYSWNRRILSTFKNWTHLKKKTKFFSGQNFNNHNTIKQLYKKHVHILTVLNNVYTWLLFVEKLTVLDCDWCILQQLKKI